ncbi:hypothetical protein [Desulfallas thermosapovorans]|uniref:hypothetical protein n=1 Tax=Desulfallas thermosapovorans TaxID=58137 RepID=UPI0014136D12|nr:hypothetical protein [Desulfallas thermosapovorans]
MACQHKRPGRTARLERQRRARERAKRRLAIVVHFPQRWDPERYDGISPGMCVAWADGREATG